MECECDLCKGCQKEIVLVILSFMNVKDVMRFEKTCKHHRKVGESVLNDKQFWKGRIRLSNVYRGYYIDNYGSYSIQDTEDAYDLSEPMIWKQCDVPDHLKSKVPEMWKLDSVWVYVIGKKDGLKDYDILYAKGKMTKYGEFLGSVADSMRKPTFCWREGLWKLFHAYELNRSKVLTNRIETVKRAKETRRKSIAYDMAWIVLLSSFLILLLVVMPIVVKH